MKKATTIITLCLLTGLFSASFAQKTPALKNGFSIKAQLGFPSASFGVIEDIEDDYKYGVTYGLQLGHQWYFYKPESLGIGLMINWVDVSGTTKKVTNALGVFDRASLDIGVLEFGPVFTYAIDDPMAIDVYYNFRPTVMSTAYKVDDEDGEAFGGFGVTHAFGGGFRYKLLFVGAEYVTGSVKISQDSTDPKIWEDEKMASDCFRILVGVKF